LFYYESENAITVDSENKIWIGTDVALNIFDAGTAFSPANILAYQDTEKKYKEDVQRYQQAEKKYEEDAQKTNVTKNKLRALACGFILVAFFGIIFSVSQETRIFLVTFPPMQALFIYLIIVIPVLSAPDDLIDIGSFMLIAFLILSPIVNLFAPNWSLNTVGFLLSLYALPKALGFTSEAFAAPSDLGGVIVVYMTILAAAIVLLITGLIKLMMLRSKTRGNT
jgi:hypothetical protein